MTRKDQTHILMRLKPSPIRRVVGVVMLAGFGVMAAMAGFEMPATRLAWRIALPLAGLFLLWLSWRTWTTTARGLELTPEGVEAARVRMQETMQRRFAEGGVPAGEAPLPIVR